MPTATAQLTEAHRQTQVRLQAAAVTQMRAVWPLLDLDNLDGTFDRWLRATVPIVANARQASATLAASYWAAHRQLALGPAAPPAQAVLAGPVDVNRLIGALVITGPASIKNNLANGITLARAADIAESNSARAALTYAQQGGRETLTGSVAADPEAIGWARATSGDSCAFCLMLASRGPVYSEATVDFEAHAGCACAPEPTYSRDQPWPAGSREAKQVWDDATRGHRGGDALNALRRSLAQG